MFHVQYVIEQSTNSVIQQFAAYHTILLKLFGIQSVALKLVALENICKTEYMALYLVYNY